MFSIILCSVTCSTLNIVYWPIKYLCKRNSVEYSCRKLSLVRAAIRPGFPGFVLVWRASGERPGGVFESVRAKLEKKRLVQHFLSIINIIIEWKTLRAFRTILDLIGGGNLESSGLQNYKFFGALKLSESRSFKVKIQVIILCSFRGSPGKNPHFTQMSGVFEISVPDPQFRRWQP